MKKTLLIPVLCLLFVSANAQKFQNFLSLGLDSKAPKLEESFLTVPRPEGTLVVNEKGNSAQAFTTLQNLNFNNPVFGYYMSGSTPMVYDPSANMLFLVYNEQTSSGASDIGVNVKILNTVSGFKSFSTTPRIMTSFGSDYLGMPQLAVMNPDGSKVADGLHYMLIARQYPKSASYHMTEPTMFLKTSTAVADPFPLPGPQDNNGSGYKWGAGGMISFQSSTAQGCCLAGVLNPPQDGSGNYLAQYGQYGSFVYEAKSQEPQSQIPTAWNNAQFRATTSMSSSYNGPMYSDVDPKGAVFAACNALFADDQNNRIVAFSKSTNLGKSWSDFSRMPSSVYDTYAASRGQSKATVVQPYQQDAFMVTGENRFSYFMRLALWDSQDSLQALDIVEVEFDNGNWTARTVSEFADVPVVFVDNDSVDNSNNYTKLNAFRVLNPMGNEMEVARTADNSSLVLKWVDLNTTLGMTTITPQQTILIQDQQTGAVTEATLDSAFTTDVFISTRPLGATEWSPRSNLTNDKNFDKGTHMPRMVPAIDKIPIIESRPVAKSSYTGTSTRSTMLKSQPDEYMARIYNNWSTVNYGLFAGTVPVEEDHSAPVTDFLLNTPAPNPSTAETEISYTNNNAGRVRISVTNVLGEAVATVLDTEVSAGVHAFVLNTSSFNAGNYFLTMSLNGKSQTRSFIVAH